jgi:hypothetical protein
MVAVGSNVTWTYLLTNPGSTPLTISSFKDDAGTPGNSADDFSPKFVSGDTNNNKKLDPGETWLYTSAGVVSYQAQGGLYVNTATATATGSTGTTVTASDLNYHFGTTPGIFVLKAINAVNPMMPTPAELSQAAPGVSLPVGTPVVWTYQVYDQGDSPVQVTSIRDDAGTPTNPNDDFTAAAVLQSGTLFNIGDSNQNGLLDPGEVFLFTSAGITGVSTADWYKTLQSVTVNTDTTGNGATPGFVRDPVGTPNSFSDNIFTGGQSKDTSGVSQWKWKMQMPQDKDDIEDSFGATLINASNGHNVLVAGLDRYAANGNATVGFWFFQSPISINPNGTFNGIHTDGDLLLVVDFSVGGSTPVPGLYRWTGNDTTGQLIKVNAPAGAAFAVVPTGPTTVPWTFIDKAGFTSPQTGEYLQAGVDLTAVFGQSVPHFVSFLSETRSSNSTNSTLSDFALGSVNNIGTSYTVKAGQYANTVNVTGKDQGTGILVSATDKNYHLGILGAVAAPALAPVPLIAGPSSPSVTQTLLAQDSAAPVVVQSLAIQSTQQSANPSSTALTGQMPIALVIDADAVQTLPVSRTTDLPWSGINSLVVALSSPAPLSPSDVTLKGSNGVDYSPVSISGSGSSYTIHLGSSITQADRLTLAIANSAIAPFVKDISVLPGDINDDGQVNSTDLLIVSSNFAKSGSLLDGDVNGDGQVDFADMVIVAQHYGSALPPTAPQADPETSAISRTRSASKFSTTRVKPVKISISKHKATPRKAVR